MSGLDDLPEFTENPFDGKQVLPPVFEIARITGYDVKDAEGTPCDPGFIVNILGISSDSLTLYGTFSSHTYGDGKILGCRGALNPLTIKYNTIKTYDVLVSNDELKKRVPSERQRSFKVD